MKQSNILICYFLNMPYNEGEILMKKKIIIVGGVAGGASTAARLRRLDENAEIIMVEKWKEKV